MKDDNYEIHHISQSGNCPDDSGACGKLYAGINNAPCVTKAGECPCPCLSEMKDVREEKKPEEPELPLEGE